jgi:hypothetical protein
MGVGRRCASVGSWCRLVVLAAWAAALLAVLLVVAGSLRRGPPELGHWAILSAASGWLLVVVCCLGRGEAPAPGEASAADQAPSPAVVASGEGPGLP